MRLASRLRWAALAAAAFLVDAHALGATLARDQLQRRLATWDPAALEALWRREWLMDPLHTMGILFRPQTALEHSVASAFWLIHLAVGILLSYFWMNRRQAYPRPDPTPGYGSHGTAA